MIDASWFDNVEFPDYPGYLHFEGEDWLPLKGYEPYFVNQAGEVLNAQFGRKLTTQYDDTGLAFHSLVHFGKIHKRHVEKMHRENARRFKQELSYDMVYIPDPIEYDGETWIPIKKFPGYYLGIDTERVLNSKNGRFSVVNSRKEPTSITHYYNFNRLGAIHSLSVPRTTLFHEDELFLARGGDPSKITWRGLEPYSDFYEINDEGVVRNKITRFVVKVRLNNKNYRHGHYNLIMDGHRTRIAAKNLLNPNGFDIDPNTLEIVPLRGLDGDLRASEAVS